MLARDLLHHNLHWSPGVFFVVNGAIARDLIDQALDVLEHHAQRRSDSGRAQHWRALEERLSGGSPWSSVVPVTEGGPKGKQQLGPAIAEVRGYSWQECDGIQYVLDVFNPANELQLPYQGAGESVLTLQLADITNAWPHIRVQRLPVRDRLVEIASFYSILGDLTRVLKPERTCGGTFLGRVMLAYAAGRVEPALRPWNLLWTLQAIDASAVAVLPAAAVAKHFAKVMPVPGTNATLLQVVPGFDSVMSREYEDAARLMRMTAVTETSLQ